MTYTFKIQDQIYRVDLEEDDKNTQVEIDGKKIPVEFHKIDNNLYSVISEGKSLSLGILRNGKKIHIFHEGNIYEFEAVSERERAKVSASDFGVQEIKSPMPSRVVKILKNLGEDVKVGDGVIVVEAMKMESELKSTIDGKVKDVKVEGGDAVESGTILVILSSE